MVKILTPIDELYQNSLIDVSNQYSYTMTKPLPTSYIKEQKILPWK